MDLQGVLRAFRIAYEDPFSEEMAMRKVTLPALIGVVIVIGLVSATISIAAVQSVHCFEEPMLAVVDGDGDGIASTNEIRSFALDNADLQASADQLEAEGVIGIRYADCGNATPAADTVEMSDSTQDVGGHSDDEGATQTALRMGESSRDQDSAVVVPIVSLVGIAAVAAVLFVRVRRSR